MASIPEYKTVLIERAGGVATITLNRPHKRNAMNPQMHRDMLDVLTRLEVDQETRVVIVTGAGEAFCSGMDLKEYFLDIEHDQMQRDINRRIATEWGDRLLRLYAKPTIAMVNGCCYGGAFTIVASCDIAVAANEAVFGLSEVNVGFMPGGMVAKAIATLMPYRDAVYYAMTGEQFDGQRAAQIRLVNKSVPLADLEKETRAIADRLTRLDPVACRACKESVKQVWGMSYDEASYFLTSKHNDLNWRHHQEGRGSDAIDRFLAKEYKPGRESYTKTQKDR